MIKFDTKKYPLNKWAFWPAIVVLATVLGYGVFNQEQTGKFLYATLHWMANNVGWFFNILSLLCIILALVWVLIKYGDIKIGGKDAKPDFKYWNWITMSLCGGIGTGLLFWAMGEPIFHFATPPVAAGVEPFSREAGIFAVSQAMWNWSIIQYCMYSLCGVAFALCTYNLSKRFSFGPVINFAFGKKMPRLETVVNAFTNFTLCGAVACSMGVGLMQIGAGLEAAFGLPQSKFVWLIIAAIIGVIFIVSCLTGIGRGLKHLSSFTTIVFIGMLIYVAIFGDSMFIAKIGTEAVGDILNNWAEKTTILNTMAPDDTWFANWNIQYWASFIVYAPVIGMFLSRIAKGRTIREFVLVNVLAPSLFCWVWIAVFGGMTVSLQYNGIIDIWANVNELGMQATVYQILGSLPLGTLFIIIFVVSVFTSFSTLADPMTSVLSTISVKNMNIDAEPPSHLKIIFGTIICIGSWLLVASGGIDSVRGLFTIVGFPISFVMIILIISGFKQARKVSEKPDWIVSSEETESIA